MTEPRKYRTKPVEVEAMGPLTLENAAEIAEWFGVPLAVLAKELYVGYFFVAKTGSLFRPQVFHAKYEPVEGE